MEPKILTIDIETAPTKLFSWGFYDQNHSQVQVEQEGYIICYAYKWLHERKVHADSVHYHKLFKKDMNTDKALAKGLYNLLDEADIVIAHNGKRFDVKHMNSLFLRYIGYPPSPYKVIDTLSESRGNFYENSHKLNDLSQRYEVGEKLDTGGFPLWKECVNGVITSLDKMVRYCKHDIIITEDWYKKIRPFIKKHPNLGLYVNDVKPMCPVCCCKKLNGNGYAYTTTGKYHRYKCTNCGKESRGATNILTKEDSNNLRRNI